MVMPFSPSPSHRYAVYLNQQANFRRIPVSPFEVVTSARTPKRCKAQTVDADVMGPGDRRVIFHLPYPAPSRSRRIQIPPAVTAPAHRASEHHRRDAGYIGIPLTGVQHRRIVQQHALIHPPDLQPAPSLMASTYIPSQQLRGTSGFSSFTRARGMPLYCRLPYQSSCSITINRPEAVSHKRFSLQHQSPQIPTN